MATFPNIAPDYGLTKESEPKIREVKFGDGYSQRTTFGLNQNPKTWPFTWSNITNAEAAQIEAFLDARAVDRESFDWTPPDAVIAYKWICKKWNKTMNSYNRNTVTATFEQVYEP